MVLLLRKISVMATILGALLEATSGSALGALMFWLTLFAAAVMSEPHEPRADEMRRLM